MIVSIPAVPVMVVLTALVTPVRVMVDDEAVLDEPDRSIVRMLPSVVSVLITMLCTKVLTESAAAASTSTPPARAKLCVDAMEMAPVIKALSAVPLVSAMESTTAVPVTNSALVV